MRKISAKEATRLARNYPLSVRWSDDASPSVMSRFSSLASRRKEVHDPSDERR